ncbi:chaoptin [Brachionus plicatilis]|uniref:Chaoptin n=1 Tax=Brachionus plicatilis TaxID=10195 RepID=A0A3M7RCL0_BRAPC|nr:chaoptin [Brachionus plicatilis]
MSICVFNLSLALFSCPFQTCQTVQAGSSCLIDCQLPGGQFPTLGNQTIKSVSQMILANVSFIPDDSFADLDIAELKIDGSNLHNISDNAFRKNKKIRRLLMSALKSPNVIADNSLKHLENSTKSLTLSNNRLDSESLNQHLKKFKFLRKMQYLNLRNNKLYRINSDLSDFANLDYLDLMNNSIFDLNITANLTNLQLSHNNMIELTRNMFNNMKFLTCLNLSSNLVEVLGTGVFADLKQLKELYLKDNRIQLIEPDWINPNNSLKMLDLSNNLIENFSIKNFINLKYLNLSRNKIKFISDIGPAIKLLSLDISGNLFESVPVELSQNSEVINLSRNRMKNLHFLKNMNCSNLKYLDVSHNLIESIFPQDFQGCKSLKNLNVSNNRIRIMEFPYLEKLTLLDVQSNHLVYLNRATLINLPNLEKFYASNNKILVLDSSSFNNNSRLIELHLNRNHLSKIPNISKLFRLEVLNLENQNGMLSELTNYAFEKEPSSRETSQCLLINLARNKISKFEDKIFCTRFQNVIDLKRATLILDSVDSMNKCILKQLSLVETVIYANNDQKCSMIQNRISNLDGHLNIGCDIKSLTTECFDQRYRCHYLSDFGKKNFTTWLSGDQHLYSFDNLYETCDLEGEHLCLALDELNIYCYFDNQNGTFQMTKIKVVYDTGSKNYVYTADKNSFSQGFNGIYDRLKKFQVELYIFPPDHRVILDRMKNIEISILKDKFYTLLVRTSQENFKKAKGILKIGCLNKSERGGAKFRLMGAKEKQNVFKIATNLGIDYRGEKFFADLNDEREILLTDYSKEFTEYLHNATTLAEISETSSLSGGVNLKIPVKLIEKLKCSKIRIENFNASLENLNENELEILNMLNQHWHNISYLNLLVTDLLAEECFLVSQDSRFIYLDEKKLKCFGIDGDLSKHFCLRVKKKFKNASTTETIETTEDSSISLNGQLLEATVKSALGNSRRSRRPNFMLQMANPAQSFEESSKMYLNEDLTTNYLTNSSTTEQSSLTFDLNTKLVSNGTSNLAKSSTKRERVVKNPIWTTYSSTSSYLCSASEKMKLSKFNLIVFILIILNR